MKADILSKNDSSACSVNLENDKHFDETKVELSPGILKGSTSSLITNWLFAHLTLRLLRQWRY